MYGCFSTTVELCLGVLSHPSVTMHVHGHICVIPACPRLVADPMHAPNSCARHNTLQLYIGYSNALQAIGDNTNSFVVSFVDERLTSSWRFKMY